MGIMCPECGGDTVICQVRDKHRDGEKNATPEETMYSMWIHIRYG